MTMQASSGSPIRSWLRNKLLEPSPLVTEVGERRRARLLAILQLTQSAQLVATAWGLRVSETGRLRTVIPAVMALALLGIFASYALVRTRHVQAALWLYLTVNVVTAPAIFLAAGPAPDFSPFTNMAFLLPTILLANTASTARVTLLTGATGLALSGLPMYLMGPADWQRPIIHGVIFVLANLGLVLAFGVHRDRIEADRSAELRARNEELEALRRSLESRVRERTAELTTREAHSRLVLDNVAEGVFTVDRDGRFVGVPSAALVRWFGPPGDHETWHRYFAAHAPTFAALAGCGWSQLQDDLLPLDVALDQIPSTFTVGDRHYTVTFQPINDENPCFLVVVADVTAERQRAQMLEEGRERFAIFEQMLRDRAGLRGFIQEATLHVQRVRAQSTTSRADLARALHTLKGNSLSLGLESVGRCCHALEERLSQDEAPLTDQELAPLVDRWARLTADVDGLLGGERQRMTELSPAHYTKLVAAAQRVADPELSRLVRTLQLEPASHRLHTLAEQARRVAERLGKHVDVTIDDEGARVDGQRWAGVWAALVHAVRNALDHGIEPSEQRLRQGKPASGQLWLRARELGSDLILEVEDDGRGIDRTQLGVEMDDAELLDVLCVDGFSTAATVGETSGRGVGMGAMRAAVQDLGGRLSLETAVGKGTSLRLAVPLEAPHALHHDVAA